MKRKSIKRYIAISVASVMLLAAVAVPMALSAAWNGGSWVWHGNAVSADDDPAAFAPPADDSASKTKADSSGNGDWEWTGTWDATIKALEPAGGPTDPPADDSASKEASGTNGKWDWGGTWDATIKAPEPDTGKPANPPADDSASKEASGTNGKWDWGGTWDASIKAPEPDTGKPANPPADDGASKEASGTNGKWDWGGTWDASLNDNTGGWVDNADAVWTWNGEQIGGWEDNAAAVWTWDGDQIGGWVDNAAAVWTWDGDTVGGWEDDGNDVWTWNGDTIGGWIDDGTDIWVWGGATEPEPIAGKPSAPTTGPDRPADVDHADGKWVWTGGTWEEPTPPPPPPPASDDSGNGGASSGGGGGSVVADMIAGGGIGGGGGGTNNTESGGGGKEVKVIADSAEAKLAVGNATRGTVTLSPDMGATSDVLEALTTVGANVKVWIPHGTHGVAIKGSDLGEGELKDLSFKGGAVAVPESIKSSFPEAKSITGMGFVESGDFGGVDQVMLSVKLDLDPKLWGSVITVYSVGEDGSLTKLEASRIVSGNGMVNVTITNYNSLIFVV